MRNLKIMLLGIFLVGLVGCAGTKVHYFNDSETVYSGEANTLPLTPTFSWTLMSKGQYRKLTTLNPVAEVGK